MKKITFGLFGAGGLGCEVMPYTRQSISSSLLINEEFIDIFFVETGTPIIEQVNNIPLISLDEFLKIENEKYYNISIGDGYIRKKISDTVGKRATPLAIKSPDVIFLENNNIGAGSLFCPRSLVTSNVSIGVFFQSNIFSYVAHDCKIGDYVTFAPGVCCNGRVVIDDFAYIGTNAVIREGSRDKPIRIGKGAIVGMGAVVTRDVPDGVTVVGNPARQLQK